MTAAVRLPVAQGSQEWLDARRQYVTATDVPVLLGLSPWKSEATLAMEKLTGIATPASIPMRLGSALEPLIAELYQEETGRVLRRFEGMVIHESGILAASPDWEDEEGLVETKWTANRGRFADGLPQDIEAQVQVQLGVSGHRRADVAALSPDGLLIFPVTFDADLFAHLLTVAADFRRRLAEGGPFAHDSASLKAAYPADDGSDLIADEDLTEAVHRLQAIREQRTAIEAAEEALKVAIQSRMGTASRLLGPDFTVTWKRTKDSTTVDWKSVADGLLRQLPEPDRAAIVGIASTVRPGFRPFRVEIKGAKE